MDTISKQLYSKINLIKKIIKKANEIKDNAPIRFKTYLQLIIDSIDELEELHILKTSHLMMDYTDIENQKSESLERYIQSSKDLKEKYVKILSDENIINKINIIAKNCSDLIEQIQNKTVKNKLKVYIEKFECNINCDLGHYIRTDDYTNCKNCNIKMISYFDMSELQCPQCSSIYKLVGTIYNDSINCSIDKIKNKSGIFNPNRHFQFWWSRILAKESDEELGNSNDPDNQHGEKLIESLRKIIRRDRKVLRLLTVNDIRQMLKELKRTDLNKNVPLILKKLTGAGPPVISDEFSRKVEQYFTKAIEIGEQQMKPNRTNRSYYPYYIYKIIEAITKDSDYQIRKILYYIYLQAQNTIIQSDQDWKIICESLDGITYKDTNRSLADRYAPN